MFRKVNNLLNRQGQANSNGNRNGMDAKVSQLESMGFDKTQATNALEASNGNLQEATNFLLTNQEATTSLGAATSSANASNNSNNNTNTSSNARMTALNAAGKAAANRAKTAASRFGTNGISKPKQTKKNNTNNSNSNSKPIGNDNYINNLNATPSKKIAAIKAHHPKVKVPTKMGDKSKEEQILRCSKRLAPHPLAVDTLLQAFMHVRDDPSNDKYRKIDTHSQGYIKVLKDKPGALDFLKAMNFTERNTNTSGNTIGKDLVLTRDRVDPALLYLGISALEQIRKTEEYIYEKRLIQFRRDVTQIMDGSNLNANVDQEEELIKRAHNISLVPSEPSNGAGALLQVNFGPSQSEVDYDGTGSGTATANTMAMATTDTFEKVQKISRRFDGDDTLQDVIRWIGAHGSIIPSKMESREWCLVDLNKYPIEAIDVNRDMGRTVQYIGCWPSGKLEIRPSTSQWRQELEAKS